MTASQGQFLPWHRHFLQLYERALREECGYKGRSPYVFTFPVYFSFFELFDTY